MDLGFNLAQSNRDLKDPTSRQNFGDTSGLLCKNDPILRLRARTVVLNRGQVGYPPPAPLLNTTVPALK